VSAELATRLRGHLEALSTALALWATRDDSKPQPEVRRAASAAVDAIDGMLADLHTARAALIGGMRASDDAAAARVDQLLGERHDQDQ
jgi:hypothetical protein